MSDNTQLNVGTLGDTYRSKDRSGVKTQIVMFDINTGGNETLVTGSMPIQDGGNSITVDGTVAISSGSVTIASGTVTATVSGTVTASNTAGDVASGSSDSGNPVKVGHKAVAMGAAPTAVTAGQRANGIANLAGIPFVQPGHPNIQTIKANYTAAQTDTAIVTVATSNKIIVLRSRVAAANTNTVDTSFTIGFGTANTPTTTGVIHSHPGLPSGIHDTESGGMLGCGADNEDLRITCSVPTGGSIDVNVTYYVVPA